MHRSDRDAPPLFRRRGPVAGGGYLCIRWWPVPENFLRSGQCEVDSEHDTMATVVSGNAGKYRGLVSPCLGFLN
jgi:hypothetical protein